MYKNNQLKKKNKNKISNDQMPKLVKAYYSACY